MKFPIFLVFSLFVSSSYGSAQIFDQYVGIWEGDCSLVAGGTARSYTSRLELEGISSTSWNYKRTDRLPSGNQTRNYQINQLDAAAGHFQFDERNGLVIDSFLERGNYFSTRFNLYGMSPTGGNFETSVHSSHKFLPTEIQLKSEVYLVNPESVCADPPLLVCSKSMVKVSEQSCVYRQQEI